MTSLIMLIAAFCKPGDGLSLGLLMISCISNVINLRERGRREGGRRERERERERERGEKINKTMKTLPPQSQLRILVRMSAMSQHSCHITHDSTLNKPRPLSTQQSSKQGTVRRMHTPVLVPLLATKIITVNFWPKLCGSGIMNL